MLKPYRIELYAANDETNKIFGEVERVRFHLRGYEHETKPTLS